LLHFRKQFRNQGVSVNRDNLIHISTKESVPNAGIENPAEFSLESPNQAPRQLSKGNIELRDATIKIFATRQESEGKWTKQTIPADVVGLSRDVDIYRATRRSSLITHQHHGDKDTFCPPMWYDLGIGSGACGLGCRACFLMLTFRTMRDPLAPVIYENVEDFWKASTKWLAAPDRRRLHTMGLGIDRSDSLLYEGVTGHAANLIKIFANPEKNPHKNYLVLLTKSKNVHYLEGLPTENVAVTFSLNPEAIADLWEGKWPDTLERITPPINDRLKACLEAQTYGFEVRWRIDPILYPPGWEKIYADFFAEAASLGIKPRYITLGTYREKNQQLDLWREKWGLPEMEWEPENLTREGTHFHVPAQERIKVYRTITELCHQFLPDARVSLCKETNEVRKELKLCNADCNCLQ
jgi:DNA repair photolyase